MKESDWKLFRSKFPLWVERYMEKVCEEYKQILKSDASACEKYNAISDRINADGRKAAFPIRNSRTQMLHNIEALLSRGVITLDDLSEFSVELQDFFAEQQKPGEKFET